MLEWSCNFLHFYSIQNDEHISTISFIGTAGGLVGLFMGMSFVSIFEIVYFFSEYVMTKLYRLCMVNKAATKR
jgi:uncharacterized membrane protein (UPF0136 family)